MIKTNILNIVKICIFALLTIMLGVKTAKAESGFFLKPSASAIFIDRNYSFGANETGIGGGIDFAMGYQFDGWQWAFDAAYYYEESDKNQEIPDGRVSVIRSFVPIHTGINYTIGYRSRVNATIGVNGGVLLQFINNNFRLDNNVNYRDAATVASGLLVPKFSINVGVAEGWDVSIETKFLLAFGGYNPRAYSDSAKNAARAGGVAVPENSLLWFGTITAGTTYRF